MKLVRFFWQTYMARPVLAGTLFLIAVFALTVALGFGIARNLIPSGGPVQDPLSRIDVIEPVPTHTVVKPRATVTVVPSVIYPPVSAPQDTPVPHTIQATEPVVTHTAAPRTSVPATHAAPSSTPPTTPATTPPATTVSPTTPAPVTSTPETPAATLP